jgi:hypothetical protein
MVPWLFYFLEAIEPALWLFLFWQFAEKIIFPRLLKKGPASAEASAGRQMQVESSKSRLLGAPEILCRERFQTVPYDVHGNKPAVLETGKDEGVTL